MDEAAERDFIRKAVVSIEQTTGKRPHGWLSRYLMTGNTRRLLVEEGFTYHMDDYSDDQPFWDAVDGKPILILPYAIDSNDMKMWTAPSYTPADWLQYAIDSFEWLYREGADQPRMMSLGVTSEDHWTAGSHRLFREISRPCASPRGCMGRHAT